MQTTTFFLLLFSLFTFNTVQAQSLSGLESDYSALVRQYKSISEWAENMEDFDDKIGDLHRKVSSLVGDIEDFEPDYEEAKRHKKLLLLVEDFEGFTHSSPSSESLDHFNQFLKKLGATVELLVKKDGVNIYAVQIGYFTHICAYATKKGLYRVDIEFNAKQNGYSFSAGRNSFGLRNEIDIIDIYDQREISKTISSIKVELR
ncbi:hypothetical protein SapgrDRAFT_3349 [Saprospira grandis DSM 2844]|uniref:Uncharacterized protein n=1 Tax=Saprospira grandis DSM 2844 TaxID=694433 RepID=J0Y0D6_9BACT|nr:hypothetical protein [Saprospira grandis]EJF54991.1 hypothetical protein SapgrDRAFT_3349 [Saprospira grandis DSM 2844]